MRTALVLFGLAACVDVPPTAPDDRHLDIPRGADRAVAIDAIDRAESSDGSIATAAIAADGVHVTGIREGDAVITIEHGGGLTLVAAHVTPPAIVSLDVEPEELATAVGSAMALHARATDTTGAITDVTQLVLWEVDDPTIASLDASAIRGVANGSTMLRATLVDAQLAMPVVVD